MSRYNKLKTLEHVNVSTKPLTFRVKVRRNETYVNVFVTPFSNIFVAFKAR